MSDNVKVRIKQRPDEDIEVSAHEAKVLRGQGLLVEGKKKPAGRSAGEKNEES